MTCALAVFFGMGGCVNEKPVEPDHLAVGADMPDFSVSGPDGTISKADFAGKRTVIVLFRSTCGDCRREMPKIQQAWEEFGGEGDILFAAISKEEESVVEKYLADSGYTMPYYIDTDGSAFAAFEVSNVPTVYLFGTDGKVAHFAVEKAGQFTGLLKRIEDLK